MTYAGLIGRKVAAVSQGEDILKFTLEDGATAEWFHEQDCCETVFIESVTGDWADIEGQELLVAEERSQEGDSEWGTETWTFYTFRTLQGTVDVRWHGESNGCYSEAVDFKLTEANPS